MAGLFPKPKLPLRTEKRKASSQGSRLPKKQFKSGTVASRSTNRQTRTGPKSKAGRQETPNRSSLKAPRRFGRESFTSTGKKQGMLRGKADRKFRPQDKTGRKGDRVGKGGVKHKQGKVLGGKVMKRAKVRGR